MGPGPPDVVRVLTWNLQGSRGVDVDGVAAVVREAAPDVVALQEVQRQQTGALAAALGMTRRWAFKHWPIVQRAEGLAILTPHELHASRARTVRAAPPWDWRRRIVLAADVRQPGLRFRIVNTHLSPHAAADRRRREASRVMAEISGGTSLAVICGDLNEPPDGAAIGRLVAGGWIDAWPATHGDELGATSWHAGTPDRDEPDERIDYVFVPAGAEVLECAIAVDGALPMTLSDHLPVVAALRLG